MTWGNPPPFKPDPPKKGKVITPEMLAVNGSEDGHQAAFFCWCALNERPPLGLVFAIPNGGSRNIIEATKFVGTGTRSGVPDIFVAWPTKQYSGLFIELKIEKRRKEKHGGCSKDQLKWIDFLSSAGYAVKICYSWTEARDTLIAYLEGKL